MLTRLSQICAQLQPSVQRLKEELHTALAVQPRSTHRLIEAEALLDEILSLDDALELRLEEQSPRSSNELLPVRDSDGLDVYICNPASRMDKICAATVFDFA